VLWPQWRRFAWLSLFSIGGYNALLYLALKTSTAINVTLVGASTPVWMLLTGRIFFGQTVSARQVVGAALSILGVVIVLVRGQWGLLLELHLVAGDICILVAAMGWAYYSWMLVHPTPESASLRSHWSSFLMAQVVFGIAWSAVFTGVEWRMTPAHIDWSWPLAAALLFIAVGPAIISYSAWSAGVARVGPAVGGFFINLTPLFTALLSTAVLGEPPELFHAAAFICIVSGIVLSSSKRT
jgi:drug/metabolite transporter (DMT)-like permease